MRVGKYTIHGWYGFWDGLFSRALAISFKEGFQWIFTKHFTFQVPKKKKGTQKWRYPPKQAVCKGCVRETPPPKIRFITSRYLKLLVKFPPAEVAPNLPRAFSQWCRPLTIHDRLDEKSTSAWMAWALELRCAEKLPKKIEGKKRSLTPPKILAWKLKNWWVYRCVFFSKWSLFPGSMLVFEGVPSPKHPPQARLSWIGVIQT